MREVEPFEEGVEEGEAGERILAEEVGEGDFSGGGADALHAGVGEQEGERDQGEERDEEEEEIDSEHRGIVRLAVGGLHDVGADGRWLWGDRGLRGGRVGEFGRGRGIEAFERVPEQDPDLGLGVGGADLVGLLGGDEKGKDGGVGRVRAFARSLHGEDFNLTEEGAGFGRIDILEVDKVAGLEEIDDAWGIKNADAHGSLADGDAESGSLAGGSGNDLGIGERFAFSEFKDDAETFGGGGIAEIGFGEFGTLPGDLADIGTGEGGTAG